MNIPDSPSPNVSPEAPAPLDPAARQLRSLVHAIAISVLILCGTLFVYLYRQVVITRRQTSELVKFLMEYERSNAAEFIGQMHQKFAEFRKQNPDFTPIYVRYFGTNEPPPHAEGNGGPAASSKVSPLPPPAKSAGAPR
jgi:hypothetical protein